MQVWHLVVLVVILTVTISVFAVALLRKPKKLPDRFYSMGTFDD